MTRLTLHNWCGQLWLSAIALLSCVDSIKAMSADTLRIIDEVTIRSTIRYHETIEPQRLKGSDLERISAHNVADALRWMSGVQLKDYGGIGGLKTVNLRSMGSQHLGIYYDGIELGNAQNGVIDLGQFSLDNVEEVSLYNGQRSAVFQTASDFANAGSVYIRTVRPTSNAPLTRLKLQGASSSTLRLSALHSRKMNHGLAMNLNVEGLTSSGKYPFTYRRRNVDGTLAYDTTAIRQNGDVQALRAEGNLFGQSERSQWQGKLYTYHANRGIPGAIVNNVWRRGERQSDHNMLAQLTWQCNVTTRSTLRIQAKYAYYDTHYSNKDTTLLQIDNHYGQHEVYGNVSEVYEFAPWCSASVSYDCRYNHLDADVPQFVHPSRWSHLASVALALDLHRLQLQVSAVGCWHYDKVERKQVQTGMSVSEGFKCVPALFASYQLSRALQMTAYAKRSYRLPTFNDLYYTEIGNALLRPETATQLAVGATIKTPRPELWSGSLQLDAYHNVVDDKIVAYPKGQQFRWTMLNLGKVKIDGLEVRADAEYRAATRCTLRTLLQYTLQYARDVTDPHSHYYDHQIPYTPRHSGSATGMLDYGRYALAYSFVYTGTRYCQPENIAYNRLQPWYTSDLTISGCWGQLRTLLEVRNLFDQQYDVIINYPMPGRNYSFTLQYQL